ncbi:MAG: glycosyltransferase [Cyanobium sp.]
MSDQPLNREKMIAFLRDPASGQRSVDASGGIARGNDTREPQPANRSSAGSFSDQTLIKILKEIELAIAEGSLSLAQQLVQIVERCEFDFARDQTAWFLYHKGCLQIASGETETAKQTLKLSKQQHEISWCYYKLGELLCGSEPFEAYRHFQRALLVPPELSQEAEAHASNWLHSFFDTSTYLRLNPDLNILDSSQLFSHFEEYGFSEGRIAGMQGIEKDLAKLASRLPADFDWKEYLDSNPDLQPLLTDKKLTLCEAQHSLSRHYIQHGQEEARVYRRSTQTSETVSEELYLKHKAHNTRRLSKMLREFLSSAQTLQIGSEDIATMTIIVIVYNKAAYTLECLKSVAASARKDIHLIVVDNHSTDQTPELLSRLQGNVTVISNQDNSHFLLACNQAVEKVNTEFICFLNNDALLCEDTISEALSCLGRHGNRAVVGGKVLHADGYIQDAGSIVFSDGSCSGLGRRRDPGHHLYNFERTVDYISGAFFAATTGLIRQLGCFDTSFAPAYYEETDLCFRAKAQSVPIVYCPTVTIQHYEFGSSTGNEWAIKQMAKNQKKFCEIHAERLSSHLSAGLFSANNIEHLLHGHLRLGAKVLLIDDQIPERSSGSGFSRSSDIVHELSQCCSFLTVYATDFERSRLNTQILPARVECIENNLDYLRRIIRERAGFYDYIFVSREHNQQLFRTIVQELAEIEIHVTAKIVFDAESLFSIRHHTFTALQNSGEHLRSLRDVDLAALTKEELERFEMADYITCVSDLELAVIASTFPGKQCQLIGHCFPHFNEEEPFDLEKRDSLVFLGAIYEQFSPNHDSLEWLHKELLPALGSPPRGMGELIIAGNIKCAATLELIEEMKEQYPFVRYRGLVDDLSSLFAQARLFLAPTRYAAGIPHKVHLASSYGVPTLTTRLISEQIGWDRQQAFLLADTAEEFVAAIATAYSYPDQLQDIRRKMIQAFNHDCNPDSFATNIRAIMQPGSA